MITLFFFTPENNEDYNTRRATTTTTSDTGAVMIWDLPSGHNQLCFDSIHLISSPLLQAKNGEGDQENPNNQTTWHAITNLELGTLCNNMAIIRCKPPKSDVHLIGNTGTYNCMMLQ